MAKCHAKTSGVAKRYPFFLDESHEDLTRWVQSLLDQNPGLSRFIDLKPKSLRTTTCSYFHYNERGMLEFEQPGSDHKNGLFIDFLSGAADYRRQRGGGRGQAITKACGLKGSRGWQPSVLDATAGLGGDAFVLAGEGCKLELCERHSVPYLLLADALRRLTTDRSLEVQVAMNQLKFGEVLSALNGCWDIIYLDPMYEPRGKKHTAAASKGMQTLQSEVGQDEDADELIHHALAKARYRVVVKRAKSAPYLGGIAPTRSDKGKSTRFDLYCLKSPPNAG